MPILIELHYYRKSPIEKYNALKDRIYGKEVFDYIISWTSPYSGSIYPMVNTFTSEECKCSIIESRCLKNPYNCIHALALTNLGELTSGLLMLEKLKSDKQKGILTKITSEYYRKARGGITAICNIKNFNDGVIKTDLFDQYNNKVCTVDCTWVIK